MARIFEERVKQVTATTGTGPFALSSTPAGFQAFSAKCAVGDIFEGCIVASDGTWQSGSFTYSAANEITTLAVYDSSNSGSAVTFGAGDKEVFIGLTARTASTIRERLTANRTYYVATTGNDSNDGLSSGTPFLTIQKAVDVIAQTLDLNGYVVTVQLADGTYTAGITDKAFVGSQSITITGNTTTPANVLISVSSGNCISWRTKNALTLSGVKLAASSGSGLLCNGGGVVSFSAVDFGACSTAHIYVRNPGSFVSAAGNYSISGASPAHALVLDQGGYGFENKTVTISGTPAFSMGFCFARSLGFLSFGGTTFSGSATGKQYDLSLNSVAYASGVTLPGGSVGTTTTGGQYA